MINTPVGTGARSDGYEIRSAAVARGIPCITTMAGGMAAARAIAAARRGEPDVVSLQEIHRAGGRAGAHRRPNERGHRARHGAVRRAPAPVTGREYYGAYVVIACSDADGPAARGRPVLHADDATGGVGGTASGRSCLAPSACCERRPGPTSCSS